MHSSSQLPPPLTTQEFYALLVLAQNERHAYIVKGAIYNASLGSINISTGRLYALIARLHDQGLIDLTGIKPAGESGAARAHYATSELGLIRLQEECQRLSHALKIAQATGRIENPVPTDIQRLLLQLP